MFDNLFEKITTQCFTPKRLNTTNKVAVSDWRIFRENISLIAKYQLILIRRKLDETRRHNNFVLTQWREVECIECSEWRVVWSKHACLFNHNTIVIREVFHWNMEHMKLAVDAALVFNVLIVHSLMGTYRGLEKNKYMSSICRD